MEETLFKLTRAITDTGTDTVPSKGGTVTYRITSLKRKLVNGKVVSTSTPSCSLGSASVSWAVWERVTVGDGYLDIKFNYSENTGYSRSTTLIFDQNGSDNKINLTVTQESGITYTGYIKVVSTSTPSCILGSASVSWAIWGGVTVGDGYLDVKINYSENTGSSRSTTLEFVQNGSNNRINLTVTQKPQKASTFTLSGLPTNTGYYLFGRGARPQNTPSSGMMYLQGTSATSTTTMKIPFYANDSYGSRVECTTGDKVAVYTKSGATWVLEGSFTVPSAGGKVSI